MHLPENCFLAGSHQCHHHHGSPRSHNKRNRPSFPLLAVSHRLDVHLQTSEIDWGLSTIDVPLPTSRLASFALQALEVDKELSPLVCRSFSVVSRAVANKSMVEEHGIDLVQWEEKPILRTEYKATTNRMLRVAVNGFMESLGTVLGVMEELDIDVLEGHDAQ